MLLYHAGFQEIKQPDIRIGRKNADFGQGFYLCDDEEFAKRWAKSRRDRTTFINTYELEQDGLSVKRFSPDKEWFDYIRSNRSGKDDYMAGFDIVIGPIAKDTIYDTWGILTSGLIDETLALQALNIEPLYQQIVIKTDKAVAALKFVSAKELDPAEISMYKDQIRHEEKRFQDQLLNILQ